MISIWTPAAEPGFGRPRVRILMVRIPGPASDRSGAIKRGPGTRLIGGGAATARGYDSGPCRRPLAAATPPESAGRTLAEVHGHSSAPGATPDVAAEMPDRGYAVWRARRHTGFSSTRRARRRGVIRAARAREWATRRSRARRHPRPSEGERRGWARLSPFSDDLTTVHFKVSSFGSPQIARRLRIARREAIDAQ